MQANLTPSGHTPLLALDLWRLDSLIMLPAVLDPCIPHKLNGPIGFKACPLILKTSPHLLAFKALYNLDPSHVSDLFSPRVHEMKERNPC